jgi:phage repressor protein C with HTH and peptisase S24 domain
MSSVSASEFVTQVRLPPLMESLGKRIRVARQRARLSQEDVAEPLGISRNAVSLWESDDSKPERDRLPVLARTLHVDVNWLLTGEGFGPDNQDRSGALTNVAPNASPAAAISANQRRIPVYGRAIGGKDGRFTMNGEIVDTVACPPGLEGVPGLYAVFVTGESMEPRYFAGETVIVHPGRPVHRGDWVVVQILGPEGSAPDGYVKRFEAWTADELVLSQLNPEEVIRFPKQSVVSVHLILFGGKL